MDRESTNSLRNYESSYSYIRTTFVFSRSFMSRRINQVNELIQREVAEYFRRDIEFPRDCFVTVTRVETHSDLRNAKIFVSVLPFVKHAQALQMLTRARGRVQAMLNGKLFMHHVPHIQFALDPTEEHASAVESILDDLQKKGEV